MAPSRLLVKKSDSSSRYRCSCQLYLSLYLWIPCYTIFFILSFSSLFGCLFKGRWIPVFCTTFSTTFHFIYFSTEVLRQQKKKIFLFPYLKHQGIFFMLPVYGAGVCHARIHIRTIVKKYLTGKSFGGHRIQRLGVFWGIRSRIGKISWVRVGRVSAKAEQKLRNLYKPCRSSIRSMSSHEDLEGIEVILGEEEQTERPMHDERQTISGWKKGNFT